MFWKLGFLFSFVTWRLRHSHRVLIQFSVWHKVEHPLGFSSLTMVGNLLRLTIHQQETLWLSLKALSKQLGIPLVAIFHSWLSYNKKPDCKFIFYGSSNLLRWDCDFRSSSIAVCLHDSVLSCYWLHSYYPFHRRVSTFFGSGSREDFALGTQNANTSGNHVLSS